MRSSRTSVILFLIASLVWGTYVYRIITSLNNFKIHPEYTGVDPEIGYYVGLYVAMAKMHGIKFDHVVTAGFKSMRDNPLSGFETIGVCNYGMGWREIDVNKDWWDTATETSKMALAFHEISHCYCGRDHDYGNGKPYGTAEDQKEGDTKEDGFFEDKCPLSLLYPAIVNDGCVIAHYSDYMEEMFNRCKPY